MALEHSYEINEMTNKKDKSFTSCIFLLIIVLIIFTSATFFILYIFKGFPDPEAKSYTKGYENDVTDQYTFSDINNRFKEDDTYRDNLRTSTEQTRTTTVRPVTTTEYDYYNINNRFNKDDTNRYNFRTSTERTTTTERQRTTTERQRTTTERQRTTTERQRTTTTPTDYDYYPETTTVRETNFDNYNYNEYIDYN